MEKNKKQFPAKQKKIKSAHSSKHTKVFTEFLFFSVQKDISAFIQNFVSDHFDVTGHLLPPRQERGTGSNSRVLSLPYMSGGCFKVTRGNSPMARELGAWVVGWGWQPASHHKHL